MAEAHSIARDQLRSFIERIERLEEEKKSIADDIKDTKAEAKGLGFDVGTINAIIKLRKVDANERAERDALLDTYLIALGMLPDNGADHDAATGEVFDASPRLIKQVVDGMQTDAGRAALVAAVDIMVEREEAEENSPEVTNSENEAVPTDATAFPSVERVTPHRLGSADANTGGSHVTGSSNSASSTAEGHASAPSAKRPLLRPNCQHRELCRSGTADHCWSCQKEMKEKELA